jgi:hypothetical protein
VLKVKVSQQFHFSGAAGCVPSLSQVQEVVLKVSQQFTFAGAAGFGGSSLSWVQEVV